MTLTYTLRNKPYNRLDSDWLLVQWHAFSTYETLKCATEVEARAILAETANTNIPGSQLLVSCLGGGGGGCQLDLMARDLIPDKAPANLAVGADEN